MSRIAAQLNTVRAYCGTQEALFQTLTRIKEMGFDGVELESSLLKNADRAALAAHLQAIGLAVASIRSPFARTGFGLEDMIAEAKALGCKNVGIGTVTASYFTMGLASTEKYFAALAPVIERFEKEGLRPLYSLRNHEFMRQSDKQWLYDKLVARPQAQGLTFETDLFQLTRAAVDPPRIFAQLSGRMPVCRLADQKIREYEMYFFFAEREVCPLGEGLFDLAEWVDAASACGVEWFTVGQDLCDRDPFACLALSLAKAKELAAGKR